MSLAAGAMFPWQSAMTGAKQHSQSKETLERLEGLAAAESVARVVLVLDANRFLIWFEGWGDEWLMWLDRRYDLARIRGCRAEVAGLGKRGPLQCEELLRKQEQALLIIADAVPGVYPGRPCKEPFPDSHCWRVPAANTTQ